MNDHFDDTELRQAAARLGRDAAERLDVEATAEAVLRRLRESRTAGPRRWAAAAWRLAAAAVLVLGGTLLVRGAGRDAPDRLALPAAVELADLPLDDLEQLLGTLDDALRGDSVPPGSDELDDLTVDELQAVLRYLEG